MDFNYTLKYRTFDQLLEDVTIDLNTFALENMIEPQTLIKVAKRVTYDLGLRVNMTKEVVLEVCHGKAKLPDDFYVFNFALICGEYQVQTGYNIGGTNIHEVPYTEVPSTVDQCATPTVNCSTCNCNPCQNTPNCLSPHADLTQPIAYDPNNPYGDTCIKPRVFVNCKGESWELIQTVNPSQTRTYKHLTPLRMQSSQGIECDCPNLYFNTPNQGRIKDGWLYVNFEDGNVYLNYQGAMEDEEGNLLVPDHDMINEYYEYALKERILENLYLSGEDVGQKFQLVQQKLRVARNHALTIVNTPNFAEMKKMWETNRKAMYGKYYNMFKSYPIDSTYNRYLGSTRVV